MHFVKISECVNVIGQGLVLGYYVYFLENLGQDGQSLGSIAGFHECVANALLTDLGPLEIIITIWIF